MIRLKDVSRLYPAKAEASGGVIRALDDFTFSVDPGEWVAIMGPSGSGKSTLVNLIGCLDRPTSGEIWLDDVNVANMSANELNRVRAEKVGFIFQQFHLIPYLSALENVMLAQYFHSMTDEQESRAALARVGLRDRADHFRVRPRRHPDVGTGNEGRRDRFPHQACTGGDAGVGGAFRDGAGRVGARGASRDRRAGTTVGLAHAA